MSTARQYRKKPIVIEAVIAQDALNAAAANWSWLPEWLRDAYDLGKVIFLADRIEISTLEGNMTALRDDWIIRGVKGELYPCKPDVFAATYEEVGPALHRPDDGSGTPSTALVGHHPV